MHDSDPAFHPHQSKRVGYHPTRGALSAPPHPSICPVPKNASPVRPGLGEEGEGGGEGMILKGGSEASAGEGSYRLKRRFEGGSHGEVGEAEGWRNGCA